MGHERTEQEVFWASEFGNEYITRNTLDSVPARIACWSRMLKSASVLISEYYNPSPAEIRYRGHTGKLFKRDFCGEMLDRFSDLCLIDYGFFYHRDPLCTSDDATFFLMEKV